MDNLLRVSGLMALVLAGFGTVGLIAESGYLLERTVPLGPLPVVNANAVARTAVAVQAVAVQPISASTSTTDSSRSVDTPQGVQMTAAQSP